MEDEPDRNRPPETKEEWFEHYRDAGLGFDDAMHMADRAMGGGEIAPAAQAAAAAASQIGVDRLPDGRTLGRPDENGNRYLASPGNPDADPLIATQIGAKPFMNIADGADPALIAARRMMEESQSERQPDAVVDGVKLRGQFLEWLDLFRLWKTGQRRMKAEMTRAEAITIIIAEHWQFNQTDRAMLEGTAVHTGPADMFKPGAEGWT